MFIVDNYLQEASFAYDREKGTRYIGAREAELLHLQDISEYCKENREKFVCKLDDFYQEEVEPGVPLCDWLFSGLGGGSHDTRELLLRMLDMITEYCAAGDERISISLGPFPDSCCTKEAYLADRRTILAKLKNVEEYSSFMSSCFQDCVFSDHITDTMKRIPDFKKHTKEITFNLSLLNDHALSIYKNCGSDSSKAMKELSSLAVECTGDPSHKEYLKFPFTYILETEKGEKLELIEEIECSPHMKLIRKDSDLRIYFYWYHEKINNGKKLLIGRIGSHPY